MAGGFAVGDVYTGEVISKDAKTRSIVLNIAPCNSDQSPVTIKEPYHLTELGEATCSESHGRKYHKVQVEELPPPPPAHPKEPPKPDPK
jgi:hypothetical protein